MNSPYMGKFRVTQEYKGETHDGLDLVGLDSKDIHSTVNGKVVHSGWENPNDHSQGFGQFVCVQSDDDDFYYYYGHLSELKVQAGDRVKICDIVGVEGSTGYSTGSHCHYCIRLQFAKGNSKNVSDISGIPNTLGIYDDGYRPTTDTNWKRTIQEIYVKNDSSSDTVDISITIDGDVYSGTLHKG